MSLSAITIKKLIARYVFEKELSYFKIDAVICNNGMIQVDAINSYGDETIDTDWFDKEGVE